MRFKFLNKVLLLELGRERKGKKGRQEKKKERILVIADLHIGYEEYLNESGIFFPRRQFKDTMEKLKEIFKEVGKDKVEKIIVLGDLKHEFGKISQQEWREVREILDFLKKKAKKVILIKGNHDTILEPIAKRKELMITDFYIIDDVGGKICFLHGQKLFSECLDKKIKFLILGHRHPAVVIADKYKKERYKCFLAGKWKRKQIMILPSFFPFIEGSDIVTDYEKNRLFIPERTLRNFGVYVVGEGKVYGFGKLKNLV